MAKRPTIKLIDNPLAVGNEDPAQTQTAAGGAQPESAAPATQQPVAAEAVNPYAGMRKVQAPVRLFPPLWEQLERLVRQLRDEGHEVDKTALLNAVLHFHGPADLDEARELANRWRALLARPPARGRQRR